MNIKTLALSALVAFGALSAAPAFADDDDHAEMIAQQNAKISLEKAEAIAIDAVGGGVVVGVDFDTNLKYKGGYYEVDVKKGRAKWEVKVDANTGAVIDKHIDR